MGKTERHFEQDQTFCQLKLLNRDVFHENILFVQALTQCFLKDKLLENQPFYAKTAKLAGKGKIFDVIFYKFGHLDQI